jgi:multidrug efflux system membrane fusion protein
VQDGDKVAVTDGLKPGDTVVVDGADRLRDGADVAIPAPGQQNIQQPSGATGTDAQRQAARAAQQKALTEACADDIKKLCNGAAPGSREARTCLVQNRASLSGQCSAALPARGGRGGRGGGGGGGFGGAP